MSALHSQNLSSIWCFLVPLHCLLLFSESSIMGRSVTFSFRSATFFLIVFRCFLSPVFLFKTDFFPFFCSFTAYYLFILSSKIAKIFNSYQTRESACTLKVFILARFPFVVLVQVAVDLFPASGLFSMLC